MGVSKESKSNKQLKTSNSRRNLPVYKSVQHDQNKRRDPSISSDSGMIEDEYDNMKLSESDINVEDENEVFDQSIEAESDYEFEDSDSMMSDSKFQEEKLTPRQKSLIYGTNEDFDNLDTQEAALSHKLEFSKVNYQKSEKAKQRKIERDRELEESKLATIDKLLNKQIPSLKKKSMQNEIKAQSSQADNELPRNFLRYINNKDGSFLCLPKENTNLDFLQPFHL